ncbi:unnamed protein product [Bursaphelenchus okinawaensis]|uniref:G-protein coupled receptors family 1 profile domain-containing protein n=1 Tax=Bursaphelenchus okinawaensis TaxID=465554 RepID=A0A811K497_9BILA|nr:unnamed protein product [Bursaphelenchus okinawaensis]CAG9090417.1 unnamed protein product [Bursaphelenchus okinawaensis]
MWPDWSIWNGTDSKPYNNIVWNEAHAHRFYDNCDPIDYASPNVTQYVYQALGERCVTPAVTLPTVVIYGLILLLGFVGNLCTCIVIATNKSMHNPTNYYLFNLAVSDLLMLILGLPMELWGVFDVVYPYRFNAFFCKSRAFLIEFTSCASVLTMTCFSIERWLAICYPLKHKSFSSCYRATIAIIGVWILSFVMASPVLQIVVINKLRIPLEFITDSGWLHPSVTNDGLTILGTDFCAMDFDDHLSQMIFICGAFFGFFIFPAVVITVLYAHIMTTIKKTDRYITTDQQQNARNKKIIKMLLAVVVTFFICWTPFHMQRILAIYVTNLNPAPSEALTKLYNYIFYCSGYFYYSNSACNPVLYNIMSTRYRRAFKNTILFPFPSCKDRVMVKASSMSKPRASVSRMSTLRLSTERGSTRLTKSQEDGTSALIRHNGSQRSQRVLAKIDAAQK